MQLEDSTILYIETDEIKKEQIKNILKEKVQNLYFVKNGEEALKICQNKLPDIILTEINLPDINGLELSETIKKMDLNQIIILFSDSENATELKKAINIGIDSFLPKSASKKDIFDVLNGNLKKMQTKEKISELEKRVTFFSRIIHEINHQWRQSLAYILFLSSGYIIKKELNIFKNKEEEINSISKISKEVKKLSNILKKINELDFKNMKPIEFESLIKINNPLEKKERNK